MKKYICLLACLLFGFLSACSLHNDVVSHPLNQYKGNEIIDSGKYYCIYRGDITQVYYDIFDSKGEIVLSEETDRPLRIDMLSDSIVDIQIGMGTGTSIHKYYDVEKNIFSEDFSYVLSNANNLVAYIDVPKENPFKNRKVVVQNIFDRNLFYKDFKLDFSNIDTPIIDAAFTKDGTALQLIYLSGENQTQVSQTLELVGQGDGSPAPPRDKGTVLLSPGEKAE